MRKKRRGSKPSKTILIPFNVRFIMAPAHICLAVDTYGNKADA